MDRVAMQDSDPAAADDEAYAPAPGTAILESIRARDSEQARRAMHDHIEQTQEDLRLYVLKAASSGDGA